MELEGGGRWLKGAIVQLGYNEIGQGILFVAEWREEAEENALYFRDRGLMAQESMLNRLIWAPILPVKPAT